MNQNYCVCFMVKSSYFMWSGVIYFDLLAYHSVLAYGVYARWILLSLCTSCCSMSLSCSVNTAVSLSH
jgi:hypothetical protein